MKKRIMILSCVVLLVLVVLIVSSIFGNNIVEEGNNIVEESLSTESAEIMSVSPLYYFQATDIVAVGTVTEIQKEKTFCIPGGVVNGGYPATVATFQAEQFIKGELRESFEFCYVGGEIPMVEHMKNDYSLPADEIPDQVAAAEEMADAFRKGPDADKLFRCSSPASKLIQPGKRYLLMLSPSYRTGVPYPMTVWTGLEIYPIDDDNTVTLHQYNEKIALEEMIALFNDPQKAEQVWPKIRKQ